MVDYDKALELAVATAREAGALTLDWFARFRELEISHKGPADFVSEADYASERLIRERLLGAFPEWSLEGEEYAPTEGQDRTHRWLVDPIDGTTNFINGMDYTISIALRRGNETVLGALYNPVRDEMFSGMKGEGSYCNGERLKVSTQADMRLFAIGTGLPTPNLSLYPGAYQRLDAIRAPIGAIRIVGSAANSCAYVALGRLTGYFEETGFSDTAAGILFVEEAGGVVTDWWGRGPEVYERTGALIVANEATHAYLLEQLKDVPKKG